VSVCGPSSRATPDELLRLEEHLARPKRGSGECFFWTGGRRVRFRGTRHYPHRLLFALHDPANNEKMDGMCLVSACGRRACVNPAHQTLTRYKPPEKKRKRPGAPANDEEAEEGMREFAEAKRLREELLQMHAALQRVEAAREAGQGEPLERRLEMERKAAGVAGLGEGEDDVVTVPDDPAGVAQLGELLRNPYRMFLEARDR